MADWELVQGDTAIVCSDTLTYSDGTSPNLNGATVKFVMRARGQNAPTTNVAATITNATSPATVSYTLTATDTATAGLYAQKWVVTFASGAVENFPTLGYNTVEIQENLLTANQTIVELDDVKDYLNIPATAHSHDGELLRFVAAVTPVVEFIVGPVLPKTYIDERYNGGRTTISLRHRPIISVAEVTEFIGPTAYPLTQVTSRDQGTIYSYLYDPSGSIIRTDAGGGLRAFPPGADSVQVTYTAGRATIPENIRMGTLELLRVNYQETQQAGGPFGNNSLGDDGLPSGPSAGFFIPNRVRELLQPSKRAPRVC